MEDLTDSRNNCMNKKIQLKVIYGYLATKDQHINLLYWTQLNCPMQTMLQEVTRLKSKKKTIF